MKLLNAGLYLIETDKDAIPIVTTLIPHKDGTYKVSCDDRVFTLAKLDGLAGVFETEFDAMATCYEKLIDHQLIEKDPSKNYAIEQRIKMLVEYFKARHHARTTNVR